MHPASASSTVALIVAIAIAIAFSCPCSSRRAISALIYFTFVAPFSTTPSAPNSVAFQQRFDPTSFSGFYSDYYTKSNNIAMAATHEPVDVLVKAAVGNSDKIGDCPFSQRVLLTLEEKGVPYNAKFVDLVNKPDWFLEINPEGKVPVIKHEGNWVSDSDVITQIIEEKYPQPSLKLPEEKAAVGSKVFPSFVKFLKSKDATDGSEEALVAELTALNDYLKDNGPFINGTQISASDLSLAPKLFHLQISLGHYKKWSIPENLTSLKEYIKVLHSRESFLKTKPAEEHVVAGWQKHVS